MLRRLLHILGEHRFGPLAVALLAGLVTLPCLGVGLLVDDYGMYLSVRGSEFYSSLSTSPLDLFRFFDGDSDRIHRLMNQGIVPWWTYPGLKAAFWRPVSGLTHFFDYTVLGDSFWLMHLESVLLYGMVCALVTVLYRRVFKVAAVAGLASLLYATDHTHVMPVVFLANRNALLALLFGLLCILSHRAWRCDGRRSAAWPAHLFLALSLLSAEAGVATCAYLAAHAVTFEAGSWKARLRPLVSYGFVVVVWRIAWSLQGYGVNGCGIYTDPVDEPLSFLHALIERIPLLFLGQWFTPPAELMVVLAPGPARIQWLGALLCLVVVAVATWPLIRRRPTARFFALGMVLSLVPLSAAFPSDRMLLFVGAGAFGLMAEWIICVFTERFAVWPDRPTRVVAMIGVAFLLLRAVLSPAVLAVQATQPMGTPEAADRLMSLMPLEPGDLARDIVVVNPPLVLFHSVSAGVRKVRGMGNPRTLRMLSPGWSAVQIEREDPNTLLIRPRDGFKDRILDRLFRSETYPMHAGDRIALERLSIEVVDVSVSGVPTAARFRFDVPLDDVSLVWYHWSDGAYRPFTPPAVREEMVLPPGSGSVL